MTPHEVSEKVPVFAVLNPSGREKEVDPLPLAQRQPVLEGKVVYCISQHVGGANTFLAKVAEALPRHIPGVKTIHVPKSTAYMTDEPELWDEIRAKGAAFIYGCGA
jgi:hypothetical protein